MSTDCIEFSLTSADAQEALAARLARHCVAGTVFFLRGDLGTGKTTFVRGFLRALGYEGVVKSPTYTLVEPYFIGAHRVFHFDLYRLADPEELEYAGGRDYFDGQAICLVEWPDRAAGFLPQPDVTVNIDYSGSGRRLVVCGQTARGRELLRHISY
jgi:tRNA threonylcarbamoyladenosine biosynthesis protein TsaE